MKIQEARFIKSAGRLAQAPAAIYPEAVFLGRSNVGKSSLINLLAAKKLAKSSSTPGKTQLINYFQVDFAHEDQILSCYFVDLPGFGYAKVAKSTKSQWGAHLLEFLHYRSSIKLFIHLIDSRHQDLELDQIMQESLKQLCKPDQKVLKIYTKCDKLTANQRAALAQKGRLLISQDEKIFKADQGGRQKVLDSIFQELFLCP